MTDTRLPGLGYLTLKDHILVRQDDLIEYVQKRIDDALAQVHQEHSRRLLTAGEVAERLSISQNAVRNLVTAGQLPAVRIGSKPDAKQLLRFNPAEVEQFLAEHHSGVPGAATVRPGQAAKHMSTTEVHALIESRKGTNGNGKSHKS